MSLSPGPWIPCYKINSLIHMLFPGRGLSIGASVDYLHCFSMTWHFTYCHPIHPSSIPLVIPKVDTYCSSINPHNVLSRVPVSPLLNDQYEALHVSARAREAIMFPTRPAWHTSIFSSSSQIILSDLQNLPTPSFVTIPSRSSQVTTVTKHLYPAHFGSRANWSYTPKIRDYNMPYIHI